jgi:hypothetical protein
MLNTHETKSKISHTLAMPKMPRSNNLPQVLQIYTNAKSFHSLPAYTPHQNIPPASSSTFGTSFRAGNPEISAATKDRILVVDFPLLPSSGMHTGEPLS